MALYLTASQAVAMTTIPALSWFLVCVVFLLKSSRENKVAHGNKTIKNNEPIGLVIFRIIFRQSYTEARLCIGVRLGPQISEGPK